jgi:hypothetical protein
VENARLVRQCYKPEPCPARANPEAPPSRFRAADRLEETARGHRSGSVKDALHPNETTARPGSQDDRRGRPA